MTISWGMFGIMWGRPIVMVMVRPTRFTWTLISQASDFTVNWLPPALANAMRLCGSTSGKNADKFKAAGIRAVAGSVVLSPVIAESELSIEARVVYRDQIQAQNFVDRNLLSCYEAHDYHGLFFGEVVAAAGTDQFRI
jgi:flavin reductase (DIM6/NTAB) family NADH-FMN oxidoreductase RutF